MADKAAGQSPEEIVARFQKDVTTIREEIGKVMVGQEDVVLGTITCIMADGHVLLEGVPGLGKTMLVRTISEVMDLRFNRIQFTPDLQPTDIIGTRMAMEDDKGKIHFEFRDGSRMRNAFVYDWRLWMLPEMQELMQRAGFRDVHVLWEGTERKTGQGNGVFRRVKRGGDEAAWIAYVVGKK